MARVACAGCAEKFSPITVERPRNAESRTNPLTMRLHGFVEPYSETARISKIQALVRSMTSAGICLYVSSRAKCARRCVAFIKN